LRVTDPDCLRVSQSVKFGYDYLLHLTGADMVF